MFKFGTKAEVLEQLRPRLKKSRVLPGLTLRHEEWREERQKCEADVVSALGDGTYVVRSSNSAEDTHEESAAGKYASILNVEKGSLGDAIEEVFASYESAAGQQVLIQPQLEDPRCSGVVFSRLLESLAPFYLINFSSTDTEAVTSGKESNQIIVSHFCKDPVPEPWDKLLEAVREVVSITGNDSLDIEFAIDSEGEVVLFQARPIVAPGGKRFEDEEYRLALESFSKRFSRFSRPLPHLAGERTILGDMPDWNPAEIVGDRPYSLAYSLYRFIITDEVWHKARTFLGYYDVSPGELMVSIGKKPYIDTRLSFNSLTPASLSNGLRNRLVNFYLSKLEADPSAQDKVEFEILWTCFNTSLEHDLQELEVAGFGKEEQKELYNCLRTQTIDMLARFDKLYSKSEQALRALHERRNLVLEKPCTDTPEYFQAAYILLDNCRHNGTFWFSVMARLAFIARSIFLSFIKSGLISEERVHKFFESVSTVASEFCEDFSVERFGHLRPGTYDICAPRYDQIYNGEVSLQTVQYEPALNKESTFEFSAEEALNIKEHLRKEGVSADLSQLKSFYNRATKAREALKFEFSRNLSDALELVARGGEKLGIERESLQFLHFRTILKFRNPETSSGEAIKTALENEIARRSKIRNIALSIPLPSVLSHTSDLYFQRDIISRPNFVTDKQVSGQGVYADSAAELLAKDITGKIVLIENADPGYDWIFSRNPLGLVTKFGGAASHMAIRCSEFRLPAAIGVGGTRYKQLCESNVVKIDCSVKTIEGVN